MENQQTEDKKVNPEEIAERNLKLSNYYDSQIGVLTAQRDVERLRFEIQDYQTKNIESYLRFLQIKAILEQKPEAKEPTKESSN